MPYSSQLHLPPHTLHTLLLTSAQPCGLYGPPGSFSSHSFSSHPFISSAISPPAHLFHSCCFTQPVPTTDMQTHLLHLLQQKIAPFCLCMFSSSQSLPIIPCLLFLAPAASPVTFCLFFLRVAPTPQQRGIPSPAEQTTAPLHRSLSLPTKKQTPKFPFTLLSPCISCKPPIS